MNINLKKFLTEDLRARHASRGSIFLLTYNGVEQKFKTIDEIATYIKGNTDKWLSYVNWKNFMNSESYTSDPDRFFSSLKPKVIEELESIMMKKSKKEIDIKSNDKGSSFDSFTKKVTELPKIGFTDVDKQILSRIKYCKEDESIYVKTKEGLRLIDDIHKVAKDPSINGLCQEIRETLGVICKEGKPKGIDDYVNDCISNINRMKDFVIKETIRRKNSGESWENIDIDISNDESYEHFRPSEWANEDVINALDIAADEYVLKYFFQIVPGSLFVARVVELNAKYTAYEKMNPDGNGTHKDIVFNNFFYSMVRSNEALTEYRYLLNIFGEFISYIKDDEIFRLEEMPKTYSDNGKALFNWDQDRFNNAVKKIGYYKTEEECLNIMTLKKWMNESEFRLAMAWAYAAIHPDSVTSNIALLLWTGGGTAKSSFVAMIKEAISMGSGASADDFYFEIKGNKFDEDQKNWVPDASVGIPKAALVNIDEATTKSIELYKDFSGSAAGNRLTTRRNYENTKITTIRGKFIFTTNKGLQLTSDDGSLLRRVAIIKNNGVKNIIGVKDVKTNDEIVKEYKMQIPMMLKLGKKALEEIHQLGFNSLDEYAMKTPEINRNLKESTSSTVNVEIYQRIWEILEEKHSVWKQGDEYRMRGGTLKHFYEKVCQMDGYDYKWFGSFKNFIIDNPHYFVTPNDRRIYRNFIGLDEHGTLDLYKSTSNSIYSLHKNLDESTSNENDVKISSEHIKNLEDDHNEVNEIMNKFDARDEAKKFIDELEQTDQISAGFAELDEI